MNDPNPVFLRRRGEVESERANMTDKPTDFTHESKYGGSDKGDLYCMFVFRFRKDIAEIRCFLKYT